MTIKVHAYKLLEDYKKEQRERAEKLSQYQKDAEGARARLNELQTQYEYTFTQSVKEGKDATAQLAKIDDDIALQKEVVARRERDLRLAHQAMPNTKIDSVEVVEQYKPQFVGDVQSEFISKVEPKLKLARDLILSAIEDGKEYSSAYGDTHEQVKELVTANHSAGKTRYIMSQVHPIDEAYLMGARGTTSAVYKVLEQVSQFTYGQKPHDYQYVEQAPKTTEKAGK